MESQHQPVNWDSLDALVLDFAKSEHLLHPSSPSPPPSPTTTASSASTSYTSRLLVRQIRRSLESGDVDAAVALLRRHAPAVLDDHSILFRLHKQKFIELLRRGTDGDRESAIECLRAALAPCALDAYPEAYEEFKHILLALIFDKEDQTSPVANEWSERRRFDLAGLLSSILRAHLHAYDPIFSMTLRYLISIHKIYCSRQGLTSPVSDLIERLLFEDRDLPAPPQESLYEAPPFDEVDIQALAHAVDLTRQGAVGSLRFAKGDLFLAFQNELCRMKVDVSMLDELVHEYCVYRGMTDGVTTSPSDAQRATAEIGTVQGVDAEMRSASETSNEDCSTSDANHPQECSRRLRRARNHSTGQRRRKRWRGRVETLEPTLDAPINETKDVSTNETNKQDLMCQDLDSCVEPTEEEKVSAIPPSFKNVSAAGDQEYEIVLEMKELTKKGMAAEVVEEVNAMDPDFFTQNPVLLFQLKQVEFLKLVRDGNLTTALNVACTHLGPLAASNQSLLKPLKETLLALLKPSDDDEFNKGIPLSVLATSLQVALGRRLGIEEPQLMRIMRATLHTHTEWFKLQMCKDRFEEFLKIDNLKEVDAPAYCDMASRTYTDNSTHGSSQITTSSSKLPEDGSSPTNISSTDIGCDENAIIKVMEFLALPRSDAIHLLMQYDGNAETVIQQLFS